MKKTFLLAMVAGVLLLPAGISADEGESIFKSNGCGACHKQDTSSGGRPSVKEISTAYHGNEKQLEAYFRGETEPIVIPAKAGVMKRYIEKTKALSDSDRKMLTDYLLKH